MHWNMQDQDRTPCLLTRRMFAFARVVEATVPQFFLLNPYKITYILYENTNVDQILIKRLGNESHSLN